jgi:hypothetical protein
MTARSLCVQFGFEDFGTERVIHLHPKPAKPKPTKRRVYKFVSRDLKSGIRMSFRVARSEAMQLVAAAKREGITVSELLRDSIYETHRIGELEES